jgi:hypothetical protein
MELRSMVVRKGLVKKLKFCRNLPSSMINTIQIYVFNHPLTVKGINLKYPDISRFNQAFLDISLLLPLRPFLSLRETSFVLKIDLPNRGKGANEEEIILSGCLQSKMYY